HLLTNAAREGCRVGVVEGRSTSDITNAVVNRLTQQGVTSEGVTVQVNDNTADASSAKMGDEITVKVTVPVANVTWVPGGGFLIPNLAGQYTLRREQQRPTNLPQPTPAYPSEFFLPRPFP